MEKIRRFRIREKHVMKSLLVCDGNEYWNACWNHAASFVTSPPLRKGVTEALVEATNDSGKIFLLIFHLYEALYKEVFIRKVNYEMELISFLPMILGY